MKKNRVIEFEPRERILEKAKKYIESLELFSEESDQAIPLLLRAMKHADRDLKREIMFVLGTFAKEEVVWPLYDMMTDSLENEEVRHDAAIQLSVIGPLLKDPQPLIDRLLKQIESSDAEQRLHATFAIGWEGNFQAATSLIGRLYDTDPRVQQTAVNALCNLRDNRILDLLLDRLDHGPLEQKRTILFNLWRFYAKSEEVTEVYLKYLEHEDPELRFDALVCLRPITEVRKHLEVYRKCLRDKDGRIRELALKRLAEEGGESVPKSLRAEIEALLNDPNMKVKKAALKILRKNR
ncbi:MAG: HEAT repeat domain-containing protein [Deltaproteobacteria bacterium]|nr:HEAT repeat domain-containing protein [Deltaproteobacteria bacterium]